jgi:hypothetical protein
MNRRDYENLRDHIEAEHSEAEAAYQKKIEALEMTWAVSQEISKKLGTALGEVKPVITDLVKAVLPTLPEEFTSFDIERAIESKFPETKGAFRRSSLGAAISRMNRRKLIEVAKKGPGPKGYVYRRVN